LVVDSLPEPTSVFGHSYGATVALGAACLAENLGKLVLYEPSPGHSLIPHDAIKRLEALVAGGDNERALVETFRIIGLSSDEVEQIRTLPTWPERVAAAHTVPRELQAEAATDPGRFAGLETEVLFLLGEESPNWAQASTDELRSALPSSRVAILRGQGHAATLTAPELVAGEITRFLDGE
jgi:pimeloyl-ACP methyl ester carboxylesterase